MLRVLIVDDHEIFLDSLSLLVGTFDNIHLVGKCQNATEAIEFVAKNEVDLVITDYNMPVTTGTALTYLLRNRFPEVKVLMLSVSEEAEMIRDAFQAGVWGYMMKRAGKAELLKALTNIANGQKYFSESVVFELMRLGLTEHVPKEEVGQSIGQLTERELEIIRYISMEFSSVEIASKLFIAPKTVETHRHNILKKLGLKNTVGLLKYALKNGIIQ